jgi:hypothetical protein
MQPPGQGQEEASFRQGEEGEVFVRGRWPLFIRHWSHLQATSWPAAQPCSADPVQQHPEGVPLAE